MKTCPACKKESPSDTECLHCGIYFEKWEKIHGGAQPAPAQAGTQPAAQPETPPSDPVMSSPEPDATEKKSSIHWVIIAALVLGGTVWFSQRGSDEKEIRQRSLIFHEAISAGNLSQIRDLVAGQYAGEFEEAGVEIKLKMIQAFQPSGIKVKDIKVNGKAAVVRMEGVKEGAPVAGTTMMIKEKGGGWKVSRQEWEFNMTAGAQPAPGEAFAPDAASSFPAQAAAESGQVPAMESEPASSRPSASSRRADEGHSPTDRDFEASLKAMPIPDLLAAVKNEPYYTYKIIDTLLARGERAKTVDMLNEMLREKGDDRSSFLTAKTLLKKVGAPVTFDWDLTAHGQPPEDKYSLMRWAIEMRDSSIVTSGKVYIGREIADGFTRSQKGEFRVPTYARYEFTVTGPGLAQPVVKVVEAAARAGEQPWDAITLASGLAPGEYTVRIYLNAQTVQANGTPLSINHNPSPLHVEKD